MLRIESSPRFEWPVLARFIHRHNRRADGRARCLHAEQGRSAQEQAQEMLALGATEACFYVARRARAVLAVIGAQIDAQLSRAWLRGPLTNDCNASDAASLRTALIGAIVAALPAIRRFDAFPQIDESSLRESYRAAGFRDHTQYHVMSLARPSRTPAWPQVVRDASAAQAQQAARLHGRIFAATYLTGKAMIESLDEDHRLLVVTRKDAVAGYLYVQRKPLEDEGYIDFLGVDEASRGHGLGRALLDAAVHWAIVQRRLPRVCLTARQDNSPALGLYEGAGFREAAAGAHMIKDR